MAVHERKRFASIFHAIVAILILIAGGLLLGIGIWLQVTDNVGPVNLNYGGDNVFRYILTASIGAIIIGGFLIVTALFGLFALAKNCVGVTFRVIYVVLSLIIMAALVFICVVSILVLKEDDSSEVRDVLSEAWARTAKDPDSRDAICRIEADFKCRGFEDNECFGCSQGNEDACSSSPNCVNCGRASNPAIGCYDEIVDWLNRFFLPIAITSGVLAFVVLLDIVAACSL